MASTGATSVLGLIFWVVAARLSRTAEVGRASAEVSAMTLLAGLSQLNLINIYTRFLPRSGHRTRSFVIFGYAACVVIALAISAVTVGLGLGHTWLHPGLPSALLFIGAVVFWSIFTVQDSVLTGLRAAKWVPVENASFSATKLILLAFLAARGTSGIFLAWAIPVVPAVAFVNLYLFTRRIPRHHEEAHGISEFPTRRTLRNFVVAEYASSVVSNVSTYLTPVLIVTVLGARAGAYFYVPWLISNVNHALLWNISTAFVVEAGYRHEEPKSLLRRSGGLAVAALLPVVVILFFGAPLLLDILGRKYSIGGTDLLRLLALAVIPMTVPTLYEMFAWYEGALWRLVSVQSLRIGLFFAVTVPLLSSLHVSAAGVGLLAADGLFALILLRPVINKWRTLSKPPSIGGAERGVAASLE